jgi:hypothetical protein
MKTNAPVFTGHSKTSRQTRELLEERYANLPIWIRAPRSGPEHYTGFSRSKLYELKGEGKIASKSIREPGQIRGTRLFNLKSILDFIEGCPTEEEVTA